MQFLVARRAGRRDRRIDRPALAFGIYAVLFVIFVLSPIVSVVVVSFSTASFIAFPIPSYGLRAMAAPLLLDRIYGVQRLTTG